MFSWVGKLASAALWLPLSLYARMNKDDKGASLDDDKDPLIWCTDLEKHAFGDFSFAVVQANEVLEDQSQVEVGQNATFVGVYDGHGGPEASRYICDHLFSHLIRIVREKGEISSEILKNAVSATEDGFLTLVRRSCGIKPLMAAVGSCCLAGIISEGTLYVANMGDSRAVIGRLNRRRSNKIVAEQITEDHNACMDEIRQELKQDHPDDPHIVVMKQGVWRIKGIIQVSRTIGDAYLKKPEFALDLSFPRFHLSEPIRRPVLGNGPSLYTRELKPDDKFIVFASDGLWEHMTNQQVVEIVHNNPRSCIARRLVKSAINEAARKGKKSYEEVKRMEKGYRRAVHDDITVAVVFIDQQINTDINEASMRGFANSTTTSSFKWKTEATSETLRTESEESRGMNRATKLALINLNNSPFYPKAAFFHSTPVLDRRRRTHWESRPNFNPRRQRKFYSKQELLRKVNAFAEDFFQGWHDHDEPSSSHGSSWFRNLNGGPRRFNGTGANSKGAHGKGRKKGFQFYDDKEEVETIFQYSFGANGGSYFWSFINDESPRRQQFEEDYDDDEDDDDEDESERVETDLRKDRIALGLSGSGPLNLEDVKNAYRACALKWHPDRHHGSSKAHAEEKFKVCSAAYQSLCDKLAPN
ncbi:hypothetical protein L1987_82352 [Smallanthus sonchifolius]|uniref:Uncharacterized protein n=1 Tax=Smallanthus sonchifolius TaxID=185202 RepID=A0ACB8YAI0_9ASTR|nr:hypothetical protein L1987_82352 [Smallanthus sonchifolius]